MNNAAGIVVSAIAASAATGAANDGIERAPGVESRPHGAVAQLGERGVRNAEVGSSILLRSTNIPFDRPATRRVFCCGAWKTPFIYLAAVSAVNCDVPHTSPNGLGLCLPQSMFQPKASLMKWLRNLFRQPEKVDTRIYTVPGNRPRAKVPPVLRNVPEPDPIFADTGALAIKEDLDDAANPYDTASWSLDPDKGLRRVDDDKTVRRDRGKAEADNPYNTGAFRRGW